MLHYAGLCLRCLVSPLRTSYCIFYASGDTKKDTSSLQREVTSGQRTSACLRGSKRQTRDSPVYARKNRDSRSETERRAALTCQRPNPAAGTSPPPPPRSPRRFLPVFTRPVSTSAAISVEALEEFLRDALKLRAHTAGSRNSSEQEMEADTDQPAHIQTHRRTQQEALL